MTSKLLQKVIAFCQKNSLLAEGDKVVVGLSGGPDSLCLLHVLVNLRDQFKLPPPIIAHLNHQLRGADSQADERFVQDIAQSWRLPIFVERQDITLLAAQRKQSTEEAARQARYAFLRRVAGKTQANKVAVGHNADDQVETVLMHFLRGAGLAGLRGILPAIDLANIPLHPDDLAGPTYPETTTAKLIRPLLEVARAEIEAYCQENKLEPRQDDSNQDVTFFRNRLRHQLIPHLESYNPNIRQVLQRTAKVIAAESQILENEVAKVWPSIARYESAQKIEFDRQTWLALPLALKRATLRRAVETLQSGLRDLGFDHIENAIEVIEKGETGAQVTLPHNLLLGLNYRTITIASANPVPLLADFKGPYLHRSETLELKIPGVTSIPGTGWQLKAELVSHNVLDLPEIKQADRWELYLDARLIGHQTILRTRRPGDSFCPLGMGGHRKKINEFMIDEKIPASWRAHIPLLVSKGQILWVCGYRLAEQTRLNASTRQRLHLRFERINFNQADCKTDQDGV